MQPPDVAPPRARGFIDGSAYDAALPQIAAHGFSGEESYVEKVARRGSHAIRWTERCSALSAEGRRESYDGRRGKQVENGRIFRLAFISAMLHCRSVSP